jgi:outer membrane protein
MKKMIFLLLALSFSTVSLAEVTVGRVDIQKVLTTIKEGKKVRTELESFFNDKQKELQSEEEKIKKMQKDFEKQSFALNDEAKQKRQQDIQMAVMQLQEKTGEYQQQLREKENKLKQPILERIKTIVEGVSSEAGVDMTFEASTAPVIYAKNRKDLTDQVIKAYDKKHN